MADIRPFPALRYNTARVRLEDVLTQPYDKITLEMQRRYYAASPHNLIAFELGRSESQDDQTENVYTRAAGFLQQKKEEGILVQDLEPSIYAYSQRFQLPSDPAQTHERRGFIALCRLTDYSDGIVHRHEQTLSKPKADRLNLLRATRTHSGQIFLLYSDPTAELDRIVWQPLASKPTAASIQDEYGVQHAIWKLSDRELITTIQQQIADKKLIIADGHHRYETALAYRDERREQQSSKDQNAPYEYVMATFINMESPGLVILPTHRVISGLPTFETNRFIANAKEFFEVEPLSAKDVIATALQKLATNGSKRTTFVAVTSSAAFVLRSIRGATENALQHLSSRQRTLDVVQLHHLLLSKVLGITEQAVREQKYVSYFRSADEAIAGVRAGANVAFLMNPVPMSRMRELSFAGEVMPQKSTDFYPKLMSGLTLYSLD